jgi:hypothetical protein
MDWVPGNEPAERLARRHTKLFAEIPADAVHRLTDRAAALAPIGVVAHGQRNILSRDIG